MCVYAIQKYFALVKSQRKNNIPEWCAAQPSLLPWMFRVLLCTLRKMQPYPCVSLWQNIAAIYQCKIIILHLNGTV